MGAVVGVIAASAARADADLLERFRVADATAPGRAQPLAQLGVSATSGFTRYVRAGVIRVASGDRFYLDEAALAAYRRSRAPVALIALATGLMLLGVAIATMVARPTH